MAKATPIPLGRKVWHEKTHLLEMYKVFKQPSTIVNHRVDYDFR